MRLFGLQRSYVQMLIKDTIETYSGQWRIIHEAIQNSHDAIQLNPAISQGEIFIDFYMGTNKISVKDNGKGIPIEEFPTIFTLGGTAKGDPDLRKLLKGSQGVGIKATVFTSDFFEVKTNYTGGKWSKRVEGCWNFAEPDFDDNVEEPELQESEATAAATRISYSLHDYSVRDFIQEIVSEHCNKLQLEEIKSQKELLDLLELYFRTRTYLGCVQSLLGIGDNLKPIQVTVRLIMDYPTLEDHRRNAIPQCTFLSRDDFHGRILRREFPASYADFQLIHGSLRPTNRVDRLFTHISEVIENPPDPNLKKILIQKMTAEQAKLLLSRPRKDQSTGITQLISDQARLNKHAALLNRLNGVYLVIGPRQYMSKFLHLYPEQLISINGLPTNITLTAPRGAGELGYLLNIHFMMDLDTTIGYGKRNIPGVVKGRADAFFADIFALLRRIAKLITGEKESIEPIADIWSKEEEYEAYNSTGNTLRDMNIPLKLPPYEEQDVICLFHQLIGNNTLKGYYPFRASINRTYDALIYISNLPDREMPPQIRWRT